MECIIETEKSIIFVVVRNYKKIFQKQDCLKRSFLIVGIYYVGGELCMHTYLVFLRWHR